MILFIFAFIILAHGLIHVMGFLKEFDLAKIDELSGRTLIPLSEHSAKLAGAFWLVSCILFMATLALFLMKREWWWMIGAVAVIFSQILIILYWQDARFGTIANIIILGGIILSYGTWNFNSGVKKDLLNYLPANKQEKIFILDEMLIGLPEPVQRWLEKSQIIGKEKIHTVFIKQTGEMKTKPEGSWIPVKAKQYFTIDNPGFLWIADVQAAPYLHLAGKDKYLEGKGHMEIKALSLIPVVNSRGKEIDQGTLIRYLAEIVWFPSAALSDYIIWEEVDANRARAIMTFGGITSSGIFKFNNSGDVIGFEAQRYYNRKEGPTLETWCIDIDPGSIREFAGIKIPVKSEVTWKLKEGDFTWYKLEISDVEYNRDVKYLPAKSKNLVME